ncbi:hypothetical protein [Methylocella sp.]|uniref:hypothetical protein n=1 Tax=Methylocella sp. TaxID=1978226 RepID=UPI0037849982
MVLISRRFLSAWGAALFALGATVGASAAADAAYPYAPPPAGDAPAAVAPGGAWDDAPADAQVEPVYWTSRCFWVNGPWGPQRRCQRVWVGGRPGWGGPGWGPRPGWGPPPPRPGWGPPPPGPGWGPPRPGYRPPPPPPPGGWRY